VVTDGGIIIYDAWWYDEDDVDGDGYFSKAKLGVDVDVPSGSTADVFLDLYVKTSTSSNYTYYGSTDLFTIDGDSENDAVGINFDDTFDHNDYDFRVASLVYNGEVIEDMVDKSTGGIIGESLGGVPLELASEDVAQPLTVTFTNQVFTPISITVGSQRTKTISVAGSEQYYFILNPGTITFSASTSGKTDTGTQVGEQVLWQYTVDVSGKTSASYNLTLSADMFYMYMQNNGTKNLAPIYVNYGLADQTMDNIQIPPDNLKYNIGYYKAHSNTEVRAYWVGEAGNYSFWKQGTHFTLPFTQNQSVTLLNISKAGNTVSTAAVNTDYAGTLPAASISAETAVR
jgi:hypothetical protein